MKPLGFSKHWNLEATSYHSPGWHGQIQVEKPTLAITTNQKPNNI